MITFETKITTPNGHTFTRDGTIDDTVDFLYRAIACHKNADALTERGLNPEFKSSLWELYITFDYWIEEYHIIDGVKELNYTSIDANPEG